MSAQSTIQILHGENITASRRVLNELLEQNRKNDAEIVSLSAQSLSEAELETILGSSSLFDQEKVILIEGLHSLPTSKRKKTLIAQISVANMKVILWEKRSLTATMLKQFPGATADHFKASSTLFQWLNTLGSPLPAVKKLTLLHAAVDQDGEYFCFIMLCRHIRQLLQVKAANTIKGPPFAVAQLKKQATFFTLQQLLALHNRLLQIDWTEKTGQATLSLAQQLDLLTLAE